MILQQNNLEERKAITVMNKNFTQILKNAARRWLIVLLLLSALVPAIMAQRSSSFYGSSPFSRSSDRGGSSGANTSTARDYQNNTMVGDATISGDLETRRIIAITDDETSQYISQVISNLDRPKPQVLIKVVFVEVTHNNSTDIGIEGSYTHNTGTKSISSLVTNFSVISNAIVTNFSSALGSVPTSTLGASSAFGLGQSLPAGNGLFQLLGQDYTVTLRALAQAGKVEVLSRPSILARNNQQASIVVGQQVPLITGVNYDTFGNQHNSISYQNVGIILQVTPFITSDGLVEMILAPQISSIDANQSVQINTATNGSVVTTPIIDIRSANTVVVTPDGQTVVIGGLIQNSKTTSDSKIPILGDIPLLGNLFKHKITADVKTELLIFLTPHVVKTPMELAGLTVKEGQKSPLAPQAFSEQELNQFLDNAALKSKQKEAEQKKSSSKSSNNVGAPHTRE
jgi:general secretion pathway protein D